MTLERIQDNLLMYREFRNYLEVCPQSHFLWREVVRL